MIVSTDIISILVRDARGLGITAVAGPGWIPAGGLQGECISVVPGELKKDVYWSGSEVDLRILVPDITVQEAVARGQLDASDAAARGWDDLQTVADQFVPDTARLAELERLARAQLDRPYDLYDGTPYRYVVSGLAFAQDKEHQCHFINIKITFKILNVKN